MNERPASGTAMITGHDTRLLLLLKSITESVVHRGCSADKMADFL